MAMFISGLRASACYGLAIGRFHRKKYEATARLLEKARRFDPGYEESELYHSYLGRSYVALARYTVAAEHLERAYDLFRSQSKPFSRIMERREFLDMLSAFSDVLKKIGQLDPAVDVSREGEEFLKRATGSSV